MSVTDEQNQAVKARGKVLVSASAGAGKTTVMIKRLADILEEGASLDEVLAVTFTKKAAAQMKAKLRSELISRLNTADEAVRENLRTQLNKINSADISTIHSFCARLVRTYFYLLETDCSFDVISDSEKESLRARAINDLFERLYEEEDGDLYVLLSKLRKKRSDETLKGLILTAYDEVRIRPRYEKYYDGVCAATYSEEGFKSVCSRYGEIIAQSCRALISAVQAFKTGFNISVNREGYAAILDEMCNNLQKCADGKNIFDRSEKLVTLPKPKKSKKMSAEDLAADGRFTAFRDGVLKRYNALYKDIETEETERERFFGSGVVAKAFAAVLKKFDGEYTQLKRDEGKLDYGDLEQYALKLLKGDGCDGDALKQINDKYKYVFVDEYQDVNPIQDEIISAVAGGDLFCVGDVKQAIYGFRGSRSRFFTDKCKNTDGGKYIVLPDNFRSAKNVIGFVNKLFSNVMKPPVSGIDYADRHEMRGGARYPEGKEGQAEICLFSGDGEVKPQPDGVYSVTESAASARPVSPGAMAVLRLVEEALSGTYYDPDKGCDVKTQAGDVCVLTRKRSDAATQDIIRALTRKYAVAGASEVNVCERPEIIRLLDVLSYIDNGEQDIPLVSAMLSPLGGFSEEELARIRVFGGTGREAPLFRECAAEYAKKKTDGVAEKLKAFFDKVGRLRILADCVGAARLIDEIVSDGGFAAEFDTEIKLGALRRLQKEAYSSSGELFLSAFLAKIKSGGNKVSAPVSLAADCVKVMTMHASKGLEFPVVIVADISSSFKGDDKKEMLFDEEFGLAPRYYGAKDRSYKNTVLRKLCRARSEREELDNEINLFYVACTRAKYALHVLCGGESEYDFVKACCASRYSELFDISAFTPRRLTLQSGGEDKREFAKTLDISRADPNVFAEIESASGVRYEFESELDLPVKD